MRQEVPASGAVTVVVEPGAEDEVGCCCEEEAVQDILVSRLVLFRGLSERRGKGRTGESGGSREMEK